MISTKNHLPIEIFRPKTLIYNPSSKIAGITESREYLEQAHIIHFYDKEHVRYVHMYYYYCWNRHKECDHVPAASSSIINNFLALRRRRIAKTYYMYIYVMYCTSIMRETKGRGESGLVKEEAINTDVKGERKGKRLRTGWECMGWHARLLLLYFLISVHFLWAGSGRAVVSTPAVFDPGILTPVFSNPCILILKLRHSQFFRICWEYRRYFQKHQTRIYYTCFAKLSQVLRISITLPVFDTSLEILITMCLKSKFWVPGL